MSKKGILKEKINNIRNNSSSEEEFHPLKIILQLITLELALKKKRKKMSLSKVIIIVIVINLILRRLYSARK